MVAVAVAAVPPSWVLVPVLVRWRAAPAVLLVPLWLVWVALRFAVVLPVPSCVARAWLTRGPGHRADASLVPLAALEFSRGCSMTVLGA